MDRPFVVGLDVRVDGCVGVVAAIGDSITDGDQRDSEDNELGIDEDARYPDFLARRLSAAGEEFPVLNLGIGGNRILRDSGSLISLYGPSLLNRLDADLLARDDVTDVILLEGINDLAMPPWPGAVEIIDGLEAAVDALKAARGDGPEIRVLVGTITPAGGTAGPLGVFYWATESRRQEINEYLRTVGIGDGTVDFDAAVRDPAGPYPAGPRVRRRGRAAPRCRGLRADGGRGGPGRARRVRRLGLRRRTPGPGHYERRARVEKTYL